MNNRYWLTIALVVLSLLGTLWLEMSMSTYFVIELYALLVGVILAIMFLYGITVGRDWSAALGIILFAALLANAAFVFVYSRTSIAGFSLLTIINVIGILLSAGLVPSTMVDRVAPAPRRNTARTARKSASRKRSAKRASKRSSSKRKR